MLNNKQCLSRVWRLMTLMAVAPLFLVSAWVAIAMQPETWVPASLPQGTALKLESSATWP